MIEIVLLGAPRGKERPRLTRAGHAYTPEKTRSYEAALKYAAEQAMAGRAPLSGPLLVDMVALMPIPQSWPKKRQEAARNGTELPTKKPDWDNFGKVVDACNLVVWVDDAQIICGTVSKFYHDKPMLAIRVTPLTFSAELPCWIRAHVGQHEGIFD